MTMQPTSEQREFLRTWFDDGRIYIDDDDWVIVEVQGRKFVAPLHCFQEVNPWAGKDKST